MSTPGIPLQPPGGPVGPVGAQAPGGPPPIDGQATVEQAWWRFMQRIGFHNPKLIQSAGRALDSVDSLMRSH